MSELSFMGKLMQAMELSKAAHVGMELTYFDVIELLGEIKSLKSYIAELEAELDRAIQMAERLILEGNLMAEKLAISRWEDDQPLDWKDLVAEWRARNG